MHPDPADDFQPEGAPTLRTVHDRIEANPDLASRQRAELRSSIRCIGDTIAPGVALDAIPANPKAIRKRLQHHSAKSLGIAHVTWRNRRSLFKKALKLAGVTQDQFTVALEGTWKELHEAVLASADKGLISALPRLMRFSQKRGLRPEDVSSATIAQYEAAVSDTELTRDPHLIATKAAQSWNKASGCIPGWPQARVRAEDRSNTYSLSWEMFPGIERDVDAWLSATAGEDLFSDDGPPRPIKQSTRRGNKGAILRVASAAVHSGIDPDSLQDLSDLVAIDVAKRALTWVHDNRLGGRRTQTLVHMSSTLRNAARYHVKVDQQHLDALNRLVRQATPDEANTMKPKKRAQLEPLKDTETLIDFLKVPRELIKAAAKVTSPQRAAILNETALAITILSFCPIRGENLVSIDLDRHLVRIGRGKRARTLLCFQGDEVKNHQDLTFELQPEIVAMIDAFVRVHRPRLSDRTGTHLFIGRHRDGHVDYSALSRRITKAVKTHSGVDITPHGFRSVACLIYGTFHRNDFEAMRLLLGHTSTSTAIRYYAMIEQDAVHRAYAGILKSLMGEDDA